MLKKTWNTQKTPTKHVLKLFKNFLKIWFSAQKSGSRLRCRTMLKKTPLKHTENTNKTCFEAFWEILENPVLGSKMWFSAQISNYAKIPWNTQKTPTKHVLSLLRNYWESGSRLKKSGSRPRCRTMLKILWNTQKTPTNHALKHFKFFFENPILGWKIRFSAHMSNNAKIPWNTQKTPAKHVWGFLRNSWKSGSRLKNRVLGSDFKLC